MLRRADSELFSGIGTIEDIGSGSRLVLMWIAIMDHGLAVARFAAIPEKERERESEENDGADDSTSQCAFADSSTRLCRSWACNTGGLAARMTVPGEKKMREDERGGRRKRFACL